MRNIDRYQKAAYLFSEIGGIDDRLLHEAEVYKPKSRVMPRILLVAACLALTVSLCLGTVVVASRAIDRLLPLVQDTQSPDVPDASTPKTLDEMLVLSRDTASYDRVRAEEFDFYDGRARLIWRYGDGDEVCVSRALTAYELSSLEREARKGTSVGETSPELTCRVWISLGDGTVVSPYLKLTEGNVGVAEFFDYDAELMPTEAFNSQISDILN